MLPPCPGCWARGHVPSPTEWELGWERGEPARPVCTRGGFSQGKPRALGTLGKIQRWDPGVSPRSVLRELVLPASPWCSWSWLCLLGLAAPSFAASLALSELHPGAPALSLRLLQGSSCPEDVEALVTGADAMAAFKAGNVEELYELLDTLGR